MSTTIKKNKFSIKDIALLGVLSALATVVNVVLAMIIHATGLIAVPGLSSFLISAGTTVVIYIVVRKIPKFGVITTIAAINALIILISMGKVIPAVALVIGGLTADLFLYTTKGYNSLWGPIVALVIYRGVRELLSLVVPYLYGVTESKVALGIMIIGIIGAIVGAFCGGILGRSIMLKLSKSGVIR